MALNTVVLPAVVMVAAIFNYAVPRKARYVWLFLCSCAFFVFASPLQLFQHMPAFALLIATILANYLCAFFMHRSKTKTVNYILLSIALLCSFIPWFILKVINPVVFGANAALIASSYLNIFAASMVVPIGLSFYTLQSVRYIISVFKKEIVAEKNPIIFSLYLSFFPVVVAGPLAKPQYMFAQFRLPARFCYSKIVGGLFRILWGIFKKLMIADALAKFTQTIFSAPQSHTGPELLFAALLFTLQLTTDFSAYSDLAIGTAYMFGIKLPENFLRPFASKTMHKLLRRWHATYTQTIKELVYKPVTKNGKVIFMALGTILACAIGGVLYGFKLGFLLCGLFLGIFLAISQLIYSKKEALVSHIPVYRIRFIRGIFQAIILYLICTFCFVFFASAWFGTPIKTWFIAATQNWQGLTLNGFLMRIMRGGFARHASISISASVLLTSIIEAFAIKDDLNISNWIRARKWFVRWPIYLVLIAGILFFGVLGSVNSS